MHRFSRAAMLAVVFMLMAAGVSWQGARAATLHVFVAPDGRDGSAGTEASPVATLKGAEAAARNRYQGETALHVAIKPGTYEAGSTSWEWYPDTLQSITLQGQAGASKPLFDGRSKTATWFVFRKPMGRDSRITIDNVHIRSFWSAISLGGDSLSRAGWNGRNVVENSVFENIGQSSPEMRVSFFALSLVNSNDNIVRHNVFNRIRNLTRCGGMHAIYLAWGASRNVIEDNVFDNGCGEPIKVRDGANDNVIRRNVFKDQEGAALLADSFCNRAHEADCKRIECPSYGNLFVDNDVSGVRPARLMRVAPQTTADPTCSREARQRVIDGGQRGGR